MAKPITDVERREIEWRIKLAQPNTDFEHPWPEYFLSAPAAGLEASGPEGRRLVARYWDAMRLSSEYTMMMVGVMPQSLPGSSQELFCFILN
jgi:hypothetical protein